MATITKTYTETGATVSSFNSTWTLAMTGTNITASGPTFNFPFPTVTGKHTASNVNKKSYGTARLSFYFIIGAYTIPGSIAYQKNTSSPYNWVADTALSIPQVTAPSGLTIYTSDVFNANNKTSKTVNVSVTFLSSGVVNLQSSMNSDYSGPSTGSYKNSSSVSWGNAFTITLNAPPTFDCTNVTLTSPVYAGYTTATATVSNLSAKYGGDISSAVLKIGSQTATRTTNGSFTPFTLTTAGTFRPTVTVTDSRGQTTTKELPSITILPYVSPTVNFSVERTTSVGIPNDEGESAVITATFNYTDAVASLTAPTIVAKDPDNITVTPTITWYADRALTDVISDWSSVASGAEVYALLGGDVFDTQDSYQISLTPNDVDINNVAHSGTAITQMLGSAFYTVDFRAGGHGIAFGQACTADGFYCNMDAHFKDKAGIMRAMFDFFYPVGSYYETSDANFDPNNAWGGTWEKDSAGRVTVAQNTSETEFDVVGETGGSKYIQDHAHGFTQPVPKIPKDAITTESTSVAHTHGPDGATYHLVTNASAVGRRTIKNGTGTSYADNIYTTDGAIVRKTATAGMSANANHTHKLPNADYSITNRTTDGAVKGVQTTSHASMSTGGSGNLQPYVVVIRWHRTA